MHYFTNKRGLPVLTGKWRSTLTAILGVALVCGVTLQAAPGLAHARAHAAGGKTIVVDYIADFSSLDSARCYDTQCYPFMHAMYDQLVGYDTAHGTGLSLIPDAAAAMPAISNGGKTYTFQLRHDVHFWNGRLVTAADWVYSFQRIIDPKSQAGAAAFWQGIVGATRFAAGKATSVSGIKAAGKFGLRIDLLSPDSTFLYVLAMPFGSVVDKNQIAKYGKSYGAQHPMGTGPYEFKDYESGQRLTLARNPHYFRPGTGHVDSIEADIGVSTETAFLRIQRGQADLDGDFPTPIPPAEFLNVLSDPTLSKRVAKQVQVATQYIAMNTQMKPFDNVLVRRAVNYAINKPLLVRLVNGRGSATATFLPPLMPGYGKYALYSYNPAKARQLLKQAGYPDGFSTTFYSDNSADDPRISQAIVPMLGAIGIKAQLKVLPGPQWQAIVQSKGKSPITWTAWYQDFPDPNDWYEPIMSCASAVPGTFNMSFYCNPKVDAFAHKLKIMTDRAARLRLYPQLDKMVMEDAPVAPVFNSVFYSLPSTSMKRYSISASPWTLVFQDYVKG